MELKVGGFVVAIHMGELFVSVPKLGEIYWNSVHGLTANRWRPEGIAATAEA